MAYIDQMYKKAKEDQRFIDSFIKINKGNKFPFFAGDIEKGCFSSAYYGWLVVRYGSDYAEQVRVECGGTVYD